MQPLHREEGLSEIVGIILILAAIAVAVALWLTFGIPALGREGEIGHLNQVRDRFVQYKINLDTFWSNRQCGTAIGTSFTLGTGGGATTGSFSFIPILSPAKTAAILALNQRAEYLTVAQDSYVMVDTGGYNETGPISSTSSGSPTTITILNGTPRYFFIDIRSADITRRRGVKVQGPGTTWSAWVNITPVFDFARRFNVTNDTPNPGKGTHITKFWEWDQALWNRTDITLTTQRLGVPIVEDLIMYRNIIASTNYTVDLMGPLSGISADIASTQSLTAYRSDDTVKANYVTNYSYWPTKTSQYWTMGSLEYRAQNEYWIPQTYYYQLGGVFMEQDDGSTVKVPPSITLGMAPDNVPVVKINEILLLGSDIIEGSGPVHVTSTITGITEAALASGNNTRFVNVSIRAANANAAMMWNRTLAGMAVKAGFPSQMYTMNTAGTESYMNISPYSSIYGVRLSVNRVWVNTTFQSAAPSVGG